MTKRLSKWFDGDTKPAMKGVYQRNYAGKEGVKVGFSYFDGKRWGILAWSPGTAVRNSCAKTSYPNLKWRGLAEDPNKKDEA